MAWANNFIYDESCNVVLNCSNGTLALDLNISDLVTDKSIIELHNHCPQEFNKATYGEKYQRSL
jgi:hypothetical protein